MSLQTIILAALATFALVHAQLTVNTPTSVQACLPVAISWTGGSPPVYVSLIPGGQPGGQIIKDFGQQNGNTLTWQVDQPAGTSISVQIRDNTGTLNYSDKFTVQPGPANCAASSGKPSAPGAAGGAGPATPASSAPSSGSSAPSSPSTPGANTTSKPASSPSSPSSSTSPVTGGTSTSASPAGASPAAASPAANAPSGAATVIPGFAFVIVSALTAAFL